MLHVNQMQVLLFMLDFVMLQATVNLENFTLSLFNKQKHLNNVYLLVSLC